jgi:polyribonucleotide nucleotidyltransferase
LIKEGDEVRILTDIQGIEDFLGDMMIFKWKLKILD